MMRSWLVCAVVLAAAVAVSASVSEEYLASMPATSRAFADKLNGMQSTWVAHESPRFQGQSLLDVKRLCGTYMPGHPDYVRLPEREYNEEMNGAIPDEFDARTYFQNCSSVIGHIRDQSSCGSCWAFGSTEAFNDRLCVSTGDQTLMSVEDTTACCNMFNCEFSQGCNGGQPAGAWGFFKNEGLVTGGDYDDVGTGRTCQPYTLPPCAHHVNSSQYKPCPSDEYSTPSCKSECQSGYSTPFAQDKKYAKSSYSISGNENIQQELMQHGTVTTAFTVYADFVSYRSGVYQHTSGQELGGHAVAIIGWGVENGTPYWLVKNSWNASWGDNGTFKIRRGNDECGIESNVVAGEV